MNYVLIVRWLVSALTLLVVAFGVVMAAAALSASMGDVAGAAVLRRVAMGVAMLLVVDLVLLVGALGFRVADERDAPEDELRGS